MHHKDYDELLEKHALRDWPSDGSAFYLVSDRDRLDISDGKDGDHLAFRKKTHAVLAATALSNGNVPHSVFECRVVKSIECTDATAAGRRKAKTKVKYTGAFK